jgi:hypothetical protein
MKAGCTARSPSVQPVQGGKYLERGLSHSAALVGVKVMSHPANAALRVEDNLRSENISGATLYPRADGNLERPCVPGGGGPS